MGPEDSCGLQIDIPVQSHPPGNKVNREAVGIHGSGNYVKKGAILPIQDHFNQGFYSRIFLVSKKDGQSIINLLSLNQQLLLYHHFEMKGIHVVLTDLLQEADWMNRTYLKYTYFAFLIQEIQNLKENGALMLKLRRI